MPGDVQLAAYVLLLRDLPGDGNVVPRVRRDVTVAERVAPSAGTVIATSAPSRRR
jgi:hypothetical protein